ncbi:MULTISPECIES: hypothetical protein [Halomonadaceae]|uniref:Uncharacterized protein n=1 Tax=Vreelandella titanicae TaxID=664683 RepID=A0A558J2P3_9GAMM|nr:MULTISPECIES: hypothetical protein [Halomonas]MBR9906169.1 hypothetical protein [Gammaproteobacteria bacterium]TVU87842.1 hypothetical protein FQP89_19890 [Halomonas titanicae]
MSTNDDVLGAADAAYTPTDDTQPVTVNLHVCNKQVPPANEAFLGNCEWYYRPLHDEFIDKSGVASWEALKAWATTWNPFDNVDVFLRFLANRDEIIAPDSAHSHWSRHANFMMRHIGCGHLPPGYYISYGYYYCYTYGERLQPRLSDAGKGWLAEARYLLQKNIETGLEDNMDGDYISVVCRRYPNRSVQMEVTQYELEVDPITFKTFAFNTHVPAYLDAGLADLPITDLMRIGTQPNAEEWLDGETWKQAWDSAVEVGWDKANSAKDAVSSRAQAAAEAANEGLSAVEQALSRLMNHIR